MEYEKNIEVTQLLSIGLGEEMFPLTDKEIGELYAALRKEGLQPYEMIGRRDMVSRISDVVGIKVERMQRLLQQGIALAVCKSQWERLGIYCLTRSDLKKYPSLLRKKTNLLRPAVIFCAGRVPVIDEPLVALEVRQKDCSEELLNQIRAIKSRPKIHFLVSSKGVVEHVFGIVSRNLAKQVIRKELRDLIAGDKLTLISVNSPETEKNKSNTATEKFLRMLCEQESISFGDKASNCSLKHSDCYQGDVIVQPVENEKQLIEVQHEKKAGEAAVKDFSHTGEVSLHSQLSLFMDEEVKTEKKTEKNKIYKKTLDETELVYWMMLAHLPRWKDEFTNNLAIKLVEQENIQLSEFFSMSAVERCRFGINSKQEKEIQSELEKIRDYQEWLIEMEKKGVHLITYNSPEYPPQLKLNLKDKNAPLVIYCKGNREILKKPCGSIVGSRDASVAALKFTDNVVKKMISEGCVVASGFAKGVDTRALDSTLALNGESIIVLPQGIFTADSQLKEYEKDIDAGKLAVISVYPPIARWTKGYAMGRNKYIYGLAKNICIAESKKDGGTMSGALEALKEKKKSRRLQNIYIYENENASTECADAIERLVNEGAVPIDENGLDLTTTRVCN